MRVYPAGTQPERRAEAVRQLRELADRIERGDYWVTVVDGRRECPSLRPLEAAGYVEREGLDVSLYVKCFDPFRKAEAQS